MNEQSQYLMRAITGPVVLITVGVLFTIDRFTEFSFRQTWPILLIVIGLLKLLGGRNRRDRGYVPPPPPPGGRL
jgi:hypothetical protein